jgi:hypothetical protein
MTSSPALALLAAPSGATRLPALAPIVDAVTLAVDAPPAAVHSALTQVDRLGAPTRALDALGAGERLVLRPTALAPARPGAVSLGAIWRVGDEAAPRDVPSAADFARFAAPGHVKLRWDVDVRPAADDRALLRVAGAATASDAQTHARLLDAWCLVAPLCDTLRRRLARAVAAAAESD